MVRRQLQSLAAAAVRVSRNAVNSRNRKMISLGEKLMKISANLLLREAPASVGIDACNLYVQSMVDQGTFTEHPVYGADSQTVVNKSARNSKSIVPDMRFELTSYLDSLATEYLAENFTPIEGSLLVPTQSDFFSYPPGVGLKMHSDDHASSVSGSVVALDMHRAITSIVYLNDDFTGGAIYFPRQDLTIQPSAGLVLMFPSNRNFPHEVQPIVTGQRNSYQRIYGLVDSTGSFSCEPGDPSQ